MPHGWILFRGNLATIQEDGTLIDRAQDCSQGRSCVTRLVATRWLSVNLGRYPGHEHRVIFVLSGIIFRRV